MEFRKQAEWGNLPPIADLKPGHMDGWGLAVSGTGKAAMVPLSRRLGSALESSAYPQTLESTTGTPDIVLGHLRRASDRVPISLANVHPFFHHGWAFIHNGTVFEAQSLPRDASVRPTSDGSDSELLFHYLVSALAADPANANPGESLAGALAAVEADYTALNSILSTGCELFVISRYKLWPDYYTLYYYRLPSAVIVCSQPVASNRLDPSRWQRLANNCLLRIHGRPAVIDMLSIPQTSREVSNRDWHRETSFK